MSAVGDLARGSSWMERWAFVWTVANGVVMAVRGEWSHASTYALAASLAFVWTVNRQLADVLRRDRDVARAEARWERRLRLGSQRDAS